LTPFVGQSATVVVAAIGDGSVCAALDVTGAPITVIVCNVAPANDDCGGAIDLTVGATCVTTSGTTAFATESEAGCAGTADDDVWYSFTATAETVTLDVQGSASFDGVVEVFSAATGCGDLVSLGCLDATLTGDLESANITGMTIGDVYYVRVYHYFSSLAADPTFDICVYNTPPPPAEDEPCGATALVAGPNGPFDHTGYTAATWEETAGIPDGDCDVQTGWCFDVDVENSQWFSFVAPASGSVTISAAGSDFDTQMAVYSGVSCQDVESGTGVLLAANDDDPAGGLQSLLLLCDLNPGDTYFVMLDGWGGAEGEATLTLTETTLDAAFTYVATGLSVEFTDASTTSSTITDWAWDFGDLGTDATVGPVTHVYAADGPYTVCLTVTDENGCTSEYCEGIQVSGPVGIVETLESNLSMYPNPSNGQFVVEVNGVDADAQITVMDVAGRQIYTEGVIMNGNFRKELNLDIASGTYLLQISTVEGKVTRKIQIN
ncbi:MAG: PKD repeat protein, partial [Bacteroidia bacterium]